MKSRLLALALLACVAPAFGQSAMHYGYAVGGDPQARPVQAFDDGATLYIQLRDATDPPAPIGPQGPMAYTLRGPYMLLPIVPAVTLRFGPYSAWVRGAGAADVEPGVVSVRRPVEVHDLPAPASQPPAAMRAGAAPVSRPPASTVAGEIVATGAAGTRSEGSASAGADAAVSYARAREPAAYAAWRGKRVVIRADGSSAGATAALAGQAICRKTQAASCTVDFRGGPDGQLAIAEAH